MVRFFFQTENIHRIRLINTTQSHKRFLIFFNQYSGNDTVVQIYQAIFSRNNIAKSESRYNPLFLNSNSILTENCSPILILQAIHADFRLFQDDLGDHLLPLLVSLLLDEGKTQIADLLTSTYLYNPVKILQSANYTCHFKLAVVAPLVKQYALLAIIELIKEKLSTSKVNNINQADLNQLLEVQTNKITEKINLFEEKSALHATNGLHNEVFCERNAKLFKLQLRVLFYLVVFFCSFRFNPSSKVQTPDSTAEILTSYAAQFICALPRPLGVTGMVVATVETAGTMFAKSLRTPMSISKFIQCSMEAYPEICQIFPDLDVTTLDKLKLE